MLNRRGFLAATVLCSDWLHAAVTNNSFLTTRGVVLVPQDLTLADWPERAKRAGLTTIGIHSSSPHFVISWITTDAGQRFLESCRKLVLEVEFELHAIMELLPRSLFDKNPELFRVDEKGNRNPDANCCPHSERALEAIGENAEEVSKALRPTTGRYFFWGDDGQPWCCCSKCKGLIPSDRLTRPRSWSTGWTYLVSRAGSDLP
jgi:hypothetical protein